MRVRHEIAVRGIQLFDRIAKQVTPDPHIGLRQQGHDELTKHHRESDMPAFEALKSLFDRFFVHALASCRAGAESTLAARA